MKVNVEKINNYEVKLTIELPAEEFAKTVNNTIKKLGEKVSIPGFRKGKVPRNILEMHIGKEYIAHEAFENIGYKLYEDALTKENLEPVTMPEFNPVTVELDKNLVFEAVFTVKPEVKLGEYKGVKAERKAAEIKDEDVDKDLEALQKKHSKFVVVEDANTELKNGDMAIIDFKGFLDGVAFEGGEGSYYPLEIGSNAFIPGFEEKMVGMKMNEERDIELTFPEDYPKTEFAGKDVVFKVKVNEIKNKEVPALDDDFAKDVSEYDTMAEYREFIAKRLAKQAEKKAQSDFEQEVARIVIDGAEIDIPPAMIDERVDGIINDIKHRMEKRNLQFEQYLAMMQTTEEKIRDDYMQSAINEVKSELVLSEIVKVENLEATQEEIAEELRKIAETEKIPPKELQKLLYKQGRIVYVIDAVQRRKAGRMIIDTAIAE